jgi:hypothetical protein
MRGLGKYFEIYCRDTQKTAELVSYVRDWLNSSASGTTGYSPIDLLNGEPIPHVFKTLLKKEPGQVLTLRDTSGQNIN